MLTCILANYRWQSGPVLARTVLSYSSSHALSCLLYLLIHSVIVMAGMAAASNPLGSGRAPTGDAEKLSLPFTHGGVRQIA